MKRGSILANSALLVGVSAMLAFPAINLLAADNDAGGEKTIKGEVVDLMCYLDHGAKGENHKQCASKCIRSGGPVGLLTSDDQVYLVIGEHKPINEELANKAAQKVTLKGKVVERSGMKMIENAQLVQD